MAMDRDELNKRRQAREAQRRARRRAQRLLYLRLAVAAAVLLACGFAIYRLTRSAGSAPAGDPQVNIPQVTEATEPTEEPTEALASWEQAPVTINIVAGGDLNVTDRVVWSGQLSGEYDYTKTFMDVAPILSEADLSVLNFEGNVCGAPYGSETISAPSEMIQALKSAGVDLLQMANSCSIRNGLIGLTTTLNNIRAAGIEPLGAFSSSQEFQKSKGYTIVTVQDIKIAFVSFTKGVGSLGMPAGSEDCVNLLYTDYFTNYRQVDTEGIKAVLKAAAAEDPDFTIAMLHWGSEDNDTIYSTQEEIVKLMQKNGVNAIIGTHPHRVQKVDYDEETGFLVAYSLGDFFGDGNRSGTQYSILLDLQITKDYDTGVTRITNWDYVPIYTLAEDECDGDRRVIRIENAMAAYELNFVDKVTATCYDNLQFSLERINDRILPKPETKK
jgi:poly-gamma-glutamate synthesis protein (capsule biosynthesis protein)